MARIEINVNGKDLEVTIPKDYSTLVKGLRYAIENSSDEVRLTEMSGYANVSPFYFARLFKKTLGLSPIEWIAHFRLFSAIDMLMTSPSLVLKEIAFPCGYKSSAHFCRSVKAFFGISPSCIQQQLLNGNAPQQASARLQELRRMLGIAEFASHP